MYPLHTNPSSIMSCQSCFSICQYTSGVPQVKKKGKKGAGGRPGSFFPDVNIKKEIQVLSPCKTMELGTKIHSLLQTPGFQFQQCF